MTQFVLAIIISIAVLVFLIVKLNVHPVISLFVGGMLCGSILGNSPLTTITTIANGFGSTLGSIGMTIIFGSIIACSIRDSGAAKSMVNFFIKLFRGKNLELSTGMAAYIMSIPVFGDVTMVLISPLCAIISKRQNRPMGLMASMTILPLNLTHSMVPPTPGILAVSVLLGADLGLVILWGIVCSLIAYLLTWVLMRGWAAKDYYPPKPEYIEGVEEAKSNDYRDLLIQEEGLPNVLAAMSPILLPVILISLASFADMTMAEGDPVRTFLDIIGSRNISMFIGVVCGWLLAVSHKEKTLANYNQTSGKNEKSLFQMMFNGWVSEALEVALIPLIVTGFGGGFAQIIKDAPAATQLGDIVAATGFPGFLRHRCRYGVRRGLPYHRRHDRCWSVPAHAGFPGHLPRGLRRHDRCRHHDRLSRQRLRLVGQHVHVQHGCSPYLQVQHPGRRHRRCLRRYRWHRVHHARCDVMFPWLDEAADGRLIRQRIL